MNGPTHSMIVLLVVLPMLTGLLCLPLVNHRGLCRVIGTAGLCATLLLAIWQLVVGGVCVTQMGDWSAPYGISLVFDPLSGLMVCSATTVALFTYLYACSSLPAETERRYFHPLVHFMMMGVNLSFLTGDLFNLFVAFEVMLMASYGLLIVGNGRAQLRQAYKYVLMNLLASTVFVIAAGMTYGMFGTLNMADLGRIASQLAADNALPVGFTALGVLFMLVFATKAGVFPLWFWLPDTYPTMPIAVSALFGGVLTKVGLYAIARTFPLIFLQGHAADVLLPLLAICAALTMLVGVLGALAYPGMRRMACLLIIVGVGYALLGIAATSAGAMAGSVFYMTQSMLVMAGLLLCIGLVEQITGTDETGRLGALLKRPGTIWLGVMMLIILISVVGLPPTSGFYGKLAVIRGSLTPGLWPAAVVALLVGGLTLLAVLRVWGTTFWGPAATSEAGAPAVDGSRRPRMGQWIGAGGLVGVSLLLGLVAEPVMGRSAEAGRLLHDPQAYREAVLHNPRYEAGSSPSEDRPAAGSKIDVAPADDRHGQPARHDDPHHPAETSGAGHD